MSSFEIQPKQPRIDIEKLMDAVKDYHEYLERPLLKSKPILEMTEELIIAPGVHGIITRGTQPFQSLKSIESLEWFSKYLKNQCEVDSTRLTFGVNNRNGCYHGLDSYGKSWIIVRPQHPTMDTTISFKNVIHSITLETDSLIDRFKIPIDAFGNLKHSYPAIQRRNIPTEVHYNFIQPRDYYLKDLKLDEHWDKRCAYNMFSYIPKCHLTHIEQLLLNNLDMMTKTNNRRVPWKRYKKH